jgi:tetratricopeptide (TPR) repeat protein
MRRASQPGIAHSVQRRRQGERVGRNLGICPEAAQEEAIEHYARILATRTGFVEVEYRLGGVLVRLGRFDEAIREFQKVLDFDPDDREAREALEAARAESGSSQAVPPG